MSTACLSLLLILLFQSVVAVEEHALVVAINSNEIVVSSLMVQRDHHRCLTLSQHTEPVPSALPFTFTDSVSGTLFSVSPALTNSELAAFSDGDNLAVRMFSSGLSLQWTSSLDLFTTEISRIGLKSMAQARGWIRQSGLFEWGNLWCEGYQIGARRIYGCWSEGGSGSSPDGNRSLQQRSPGDYVYNGSSLTLTENINCTNFVVRVDNDFIIESNVVVIATESISVVANKITIKLYAEMHAQQNITLVAAAEVLLQSAKLFSAASVNIDAVYQFWMTVQASVTAQSLYATTAFVQIDSGSSLSISNVLSLSGTGRFGYPGIRYAGTLSLPHPSSVDLYGLAGTEAGVEISSSVSQQAFSPASLNINGISDSGNGVAIDCILVLNATSAFIVGNSSTSQGVEFSNGLIIFDDATVDIHGNGSAFGVVLNHITMDDSSELDVTGESGSDFSIFAEDVDWTLDGFIYLHTGSSLSISLPQPMGGVKLATGSHSIHLTSSEGAVILEENLVLLRCSGQFAQLSAPYRSGSIFPVPQILRPSLNISQLNFQEDITLMISVANETHYGSVEISELSAPVNKKQRLIVESVALPNGTTIRPLVYASRSDRDLEYAGEPLANGTFIVAESENFTSVLGDDDLYYVELTAIGQELPEKSPSVTSTSTMSATLSPSISVSYSDTCSSTNSPSGVPSQTMTSSRSISSSSQLSSSMSPTVTTTESTSYTPSRSSSSSDSATKTPPASHAESRSQTPLSSLSTTSSVFPTPSDSLSRTSSFFASKSTLFSFRSSPTPSSTRSTEISSTETPSGTGRGSSSPTSSSSNSASGSFTRFSSVVATITTSSVSVSPSSSASVSAPQSRSILLLPPVNDLDASPTQRIPQASRSHILVATPLRTMSVVQPVGNMPGGDRPTCARSSCDSGGGTVNVPDGSNTVNVPIVNDDGTPVGSVSVPNNPTGDGQSYDVEVNWTIDRGSPLSGGLRPGSTLLEVNLFDSQGRHVTKFNDALEICIQEESSQVDKDTCLGYWDTTKREWVCEDPCLNSQGDGKLWCGKTDHLTSFALLLGGNRGSDPCGDDEGYTVAWISLGFICAAVIVVALAAVLVELKYQYRRFNTTDLIRSVEITD